MKKKLVLMIAFIIALSHMTSPHFNANDDFANKEQEYIELCKRIDLSVSQAETCKAFKSYMENRNSELETKADELKNEISKTKSEIVDLIAEIDRIDGEIILKEDEITALEERIIALEERIEQRKQEILDRLYKMQSIMNSNVYIEIIFNSTSLESLFTRLEGVKALTEYDVDLMTEYQSDKDQLVVDQESLNSALLALEDLKETNILLKEEFVSRQAALEVQLDDTITVSDTLKNSISNINTDAYIPPNEGGTGGGTPSAGWSYPTARAWISAGTFTYPGSSSPHNGVDFAAPLGTPIYAPVNGYVVAVKDNCPNFGSWGDGCKDYYTANYVIMVAQVNGNVYSIEFAHNQQGSAAANGWNGEIRYVTQGTQIANVASSGYSTGPHMHNTIINHGSNRSVFDVVNQLYNGGSYFFGLSTGNPYGSSCAVKSTPCWERPEDIYGVYVGSSY